MLVLHAQKVLSSGVMPWDFALILIFLGTAVPLLGRRRIHQLLQAPQTTKAERLTLYASTVAFQWIAVALILWRISAHKIASALLGLAIPEPGLTVGVAIVLCALVLTNQLISLRRLATMPLETQGIVPQLALKLFPQDNVERLAFFAVVVTVSICEELIFRGFAQYAFQAALRGSILVGIVASAVLFSIAHLYQGRKGLLATFILGLLFSAVRSWTGSLFAPMVAHFTADLTAGFSAPKRLRAAASSSAATASDADA